MNLPDYISNGLIDLMMIKICLMWDLLEAYILCISRFCRNDDEYLNQNQNYLVRYACCMHIWIFNKFQKQYNAFLKCMFLFPPQHQWSFFSRIQASLLCDMCQHFKNLYLKKIEWCQRCNETPSDCVIRLVKIFEVIIHLTSTYSLNASSYLSNLIIKMWERL